jgi:hypothetical protein
VPEHPGVREAHLLRKRNNPLFRPAARAVANEQLASARLEDGVEMDNFMRDFRELVQQAADLEANTPSETVLALKEQLDQSYQRACALPGDQSQVKDAIRKLIVIIMQAVRGGIGNDSYAAARLDEEDAARQTHYALQELPLVAALTHPESPVGEDELIPSLLSEDDDSLLRCLLIFDSTQVGAICSDAADYLEEIDPQRNLSDAWRRLGLLLDYYRDHAPDSGAN